MGYHFHGSFGIVVISKLPFKKQISFVRFSFETPPKKSKKWMPFHRFFFLSPFLGSTVLGLKTFVPKPGRNKVKAKTRVLMPATRPLTINRRSFIAFNRKTLTMRTKRISRQKRSSEVAKTSSKSAEKNRKQREMTGRLASRSRFWRFETQTLGFWPSIWHVSTNELHGHIHQTANGQHHIKVIPSTVLAQQPSLST